MMMCSWLDRHHLVSPPSLAPSSTCRPSSPSSISTVMLATTNRPADVDACFRRGGRLDREVDVLGSSVTDRKGCEQNIRRVYINQITYCLF